MKYCIQFKNEFHSFRYSKPVILLFAYHHKPLFCRSIELLLWFLVTTWKCSHIYFFLCYEIYNHLSKNAPNVWVYQIEDNKCQVTLLSMSIFNGTNKNAATYILGVDLSLHIKL